MGASGYKLRLLKRPHYRKSSLAECLRLSSCTIQITS